jgi:hypothetical protein
LGRRELETGDTAAGDRALHQGGVHGVIDVELSGVFGAAVTLSRPSRRSMGNPVTRVIR